MERDIHTRIIGDQIIITDGKFLINKSRNSTYITYIGDNDGPEKVLLNIPEIGYYEISYNDTEGITYRSVDKPHQENNNNNDNDIQP
jgi:hypothetical protein